jgi:hypothetical protein
MEHFINRIFKQDVLYTCIRGVIVGMLVCLASCKKYDTPAAIAVDIPEQGETKVQRRVLWINIDGAVGEVVKDHVPVNIKGMMPHSKYTFAGLSDNREAIDTEAEDCTNWTTLLTGVIAAKHKVKDNSYIPDLVVNPDIPNQAVAYYPNIIRHITTTFPNAKTLCITPWKTLNENMLNNTTKTITSVSDEQTRDLLIDNLENADMNFTLASFKGMQEAGEAGGFSASNAAYINALNTIDNYIGECLKKINERKDAQNEDWLIVITSDHGGTEDGQWAGASKTERNNFCMFYYNHYVSQEMKGETIYAAYFNPSNSAKVLDPLQFYSAGQGRTLSVEFTVRLEPSATGSYTSGWNRMLGKKSWGVYRQNSETIFRMEAGENGIDAIQKGIPGFDNTLWHFYQLGMSSPTLTTKSYLIFYDGELKLRGTANTASYLADVNSLDIGGTAIPTPYYISELRVWDTMLGEQVFVNNSSLINIKPEHPQYAHLIGYWKFSPDAFIDAKTVKNEIAGKPNLVFNTVPKIAEFANTLPQNRKSGNLIMENAMVVPQILYWLNVGQPANMDGFNFLQNYNLEEAWREQ